jgi:hypothetical protein
MLLILQKLDSLCETNYVKTFVDEIEEEKRQQSKLNAISSIDWNVFRTASWDI